MPLAYEVLFKKAVRLNQVWPYRPYTVNVA